MPPKVERKGQAGAGRRQSRKRATEAALREAAVRLIAERGFDATTTDDIARAAGVSPRTFFNYFPTKDAVVFLPAGIVPTLIEKSLLARPAGEDPVASMGATTIEVFSQLSALIGAGAVPLFRATMRMVTTEPEIRRIMLERRVVAEEVAWATLQGRGVSPEDLGARAAVSTVISAAFLALTLWAARDDDEPLLAVTARCLLAIPHPSRLAAGVASVLP